MTHPASHRRQPNTLATPRLPSVTALLLLSALAACAGDLDPRFVKGEGSGGAPVSGSGSGGMTGSSSSGGATVSSSSGGAPATTSSGGASGGTAACDAVAMVFTPKCVSGCHMPGGLWPQVDLSSDAMIAKTVIGVTQNFPCAGDMTDKIINASAPLAGSLLHFITGQTCGSGTQMPFLQTPLMQSEIDCIESYFTSKLH
jgi:hypothetical protein